MELKIKFVESFANALRSCQNPARQKTFYIVPVVANLRRLEQLLPNRHTAEGAPSIYEMARIIADGLPAQGHSHVLVILSQIILALVEVLRRALPKDESGGAENQVEQMRKLVTAQMHFAALDYFDCYVLEIMKLCLPPDAYADFLKVTAECGAKASPWGSIEQLKAIYLDVDSISQFIREQVSESVLVKTIDSSGGATSPTLGSQPETQTRTGLFLHIVENTVIPRRVSIWSPLGSVGVVKTYDSLDTFLEVASNRLQLSKTTPKIAGPLWDSTDHLFEIGCNPSGATLPKAEQQSEFALLTFVSQAIWQSVNPQLAPV